MAVEDVVKRIKDDIELVEMTLISNMDAIKELADRTASAEEKIEFLRTGYSSFGGRGCPACVYDDGTFRSPCRLHQEMDSRDRLYMTRLTEILKLLESCRSQFMALPDGWGEAMPAALTPTLQELRIVVGDQTNAPAPEHDEFELQVD